MKRNLVDSIGYALGSILAIVVFACLITLVVGVTIAFLGRMF